ncbi:hypothetical protein JXR93_10130 [bacterium]|nr:hypothetical protein [bacterium]
MRVFLVVCLFLLSISLFSEEVKKIKVSVMDLKAEIGVDERVVNLLYEVILSEFQKYSNLSIISKTDITSMIQHEAQKEILGCNEDSCMAEIGGALGVDKIVLGNVGQIGNSFIITLKLADVKNAMVENRVSKTITMDENKLVPLVKILANELFNSFKQFRTEPLEDLSLDDNKGKKESSPSKIFTWITLGTSVVLFGIGGYFYLDANSIQDDLNSGKYAGEDIEKTAQEDYESSVLMKQVFLSLGAVTLIGSGILFFFEGEGSKPESKSSFKISPVITSDNFFVFTSFSF